MEWIWLPMVFLTIAGAAAIGVMPWEKWRGHGR